MIKRNNKETKKETLETIVYWNNIGRAVIKKTKYTYPDGLVEYEKTAIYDNSNPTIKNYLKSIRAID